MADVDPSEVEPNKTKNQEPSQSLFALRMPFMQALITERESIRNRAYAAIYPILTHYHNVNLLAAGIAGIVVPILSTQGSALINPWFLTRVAVCMGLTIFVGVLACAYLRFTSGLYLRELELRFHSENYALANAENTEQAINYALQVVNTVHAGKRERAEFRIGLIVFFDIGFYGIFLRGIVYLIEGFVLK